MNKPTETIFIPEENDEETTKNYYDMLDEMYR